MHVNKRKLLCILLLPGAQPVWSPRDTNPGLTFEAPRCARQEFHGGGDIHVHLDRVP